MAPFGLTSAIPLQGLTEEDRSFVGVHLAQVLSDIGVPHGDEVLRRIGDDGGTEGTGAGVRHPVNGAVEPW
ncbi:hypothetical protein [Streptomyces oceani]|nr:hypothetical protein [Streptomyces oceani]